MGTKVGYIIDFKKQLYLCLPNCEKFKNIHAHTHILKPNFLKTKKVAKVVHCHFY